MAPDVFALVAKREHDVEEAVNNRVADFIAKMDPFLPLMRKFDIVFTDDYARPEDGLNPQGKLMLEMWGYSTRDDASFKHLMQFIINLQGNAAVKKGNPTPETILFSRAMLAAPVFMMEQVNRLAMLYEERLAENRDAGDFDPHAGIE